MVKKQRDAHSKTTATTSKLAIMSRRDASGKELPDEDDDDSDLSFRSQNHKDGQWRTKIRVRRLSLTPAKIPPQAKKKKKKKNRPFMCSTTKESRRHNRCCGDGLDFDSSSNSSSGDDDNARKIQPRTILLSPRKCRHSSVSSSTGGRQMLTPVMTTTTTTTTTRDGADDTDDDDKDEDVDRTVFTQGRVGWNARHSRGSYAAAAAAAANAYAYAYARDAQSSEEDSQDTIAVTTRTTFAAAVQSSKRLKKRANVSPRASQKKTALDVLRSSDEDSGDINALTNRTTLTAAQTSNRLTKVSPRNDDDSKGRDRAVTTSRSAAAVQTSNRLKKCAKISPYSFQKTSVDLPLSSDDDALDRILMTTRRSGAAVHTSNLMKESALVSPPSSQETVLSNDEVSAVCMPTTTRKSSEAVQTANSRKKNADFSGSSQGVDRVPVTRRTSGAAVQTSNRQKTIAKISPPSSQEVGSEVLSNDEYFADRIPITTRRSSTAVQTANRRKKNAADFPLDSSPETDLDVLLSSDKYSEDRTPMTTRRLNAVPTTNSLTKQAKVSTDLIWNVASSCHEWSDCDDDDERKPAPSATSVRNGKITSASTACIPAMKLVHNDHTKFERASPLSLETMLLNNACKNPSNVSTPLAQSHSSGRESFPLLRRIKTSQKRINEKCDDAESKAKNGNTVVCIRTDVCADDKLLSVAYLEEPPCRRHNLSRKRKGHNNDENVTLKRISRWTKDDELVAPTTTTTAPMEYEPVLGSFQETDLHISLVQRCQQRSYSGESSDLDVEELDEAAYKCGGESTFFAKRFEGRFPRLLQFIPLEETYVSIYKWDVQVHRLQTRYISKV